MIRHLVNLLLWPLPPSRMFGFRRWWLRLAGIEIAANASLCGRGWIYGRGRLAVGAASWLSPGVIVFSHEQAAVTIGACCDIGPNVGFITGGHDMGPAGRRAGAGTAKPIAVGAGCWIGAGSMILGGVTIGSGAVVAAGSVVAADVAADTLVGGVPARLIRSLS